jgi:hypothetical protein
MDNASVLSRRDVRLVMKAAREQVLLGPKLGTGYPIADRRPGLLGDLELDRPGRFLLDHGSTVPYLRSDTYVLHSEPHEVATAQLAVDRDIKQCQVPATVFKLESDADRPDLFWFERTLLADEAPLVPGVSSKTNKRWDHGAHGSLLDPDRPRRSAAHTLSRSVIIDRRPLWLKKADVPFRS